MSVEIRIRMEGEDVAKWAANHPQRRALGSEPRPRVQKLLPDGVAIVGGSSPIYRDVADDWPLTPAADALPYLGSDSHVMLVFYQGSWCEGINERDTAALCVAALATIEVAMGDLRPSKLSIDVERS